MKKRFFLEIIQITATIVLGLLSVVIPVISLEGTFIVVSLGISITLGTILLKRELMLHIDERLEIYSLLNEIDNRELREFGYLAINNAKDQVRKLRDGIVTLGVEEVYSTAIARIETAKKGETILAAHVASEGIEYVHAWEELVPLRNYFIKNKQAIDRGVIIGRVFVIKKSDFPNSKNDLTNRTLKILKSHSEIGVEVTIVWFEDLLDTSIVVEDYIVFGNSLVETHQIGVDGRHYQLTMHRDKAEVNRYIDRFRKLKNFGRPLNQIVTDLESKGLPYK